MRSVHTSISVKTSLSSTTAHPTDTPIHHSSLPFSAFLSPSSAPSAFISPFRSDRALTTPRYPNAPVNRPTLYALTAGHWMVDLCQGIVPAMLPFLVQSGSITSKAEAGRLVLAMSLASAVVQPGFGLYADKRPTGWVLPVSVALATICVILGAITDSNLGAWLALAIAGIGVAAFHPEAAKRAAAAAGGKKSSGMSLFALGGTVGFATAPLLTSPILEHLGRQGLWLVLLPGVAVAVLLQLYASKSFLTKAAATEVAQSGNPTDKPRVNNWSGFSILAAAMTMRAIAFYGLNTFLALFFMQKFGAEAKIANIPLSIFLLSSIPGTLLGGRLADHWSRTGTVITGLLTVTVTLALLIACPWQSVSWALCVPLGIGLFLPSSVMVIMGQELLPTRPGLASGVTLGLAVSVGGLMAPIIGLIGDAYGLSTSLWTIGGICLAGAILIRLTPKY